MVCTQGWLLENGQGLFQVAETVITSGLDVLTLERISSMFPSSTILPWSMIPISVHSSDNSDSTWELMTMVLPLSCSSDSISLNSNLVLGSRPEVAHPVSVWTGHGSMPWQGRAFVSSPWKGRPHKSPAYLPGPPAPKGRCSASLPPAVHVMAGGEKLHVL